MSCDFVVHPIRWDRCLLAAADPHGHTWLTLQSHRGLAQNTLDAYSRGLERYFHFLTRLRLSCVSVTRAEVAFYLGSLQADGSRLSNATMQQLLTVVRLFHAYLMEEGVRANNPAHGHAGRPLIARHHKLPWIPNDDDWHSILACSHDSYIKTVAQKLKNNAWPREDSVRSGNNLTFVEIDGLSAMGIVPLHFYRK